VFLFLGIVCNEFGQFQRAKFQNGSILRPVNGGVVGLISFGGKAVASGVDPQVRILSAINLEIDYGDGNFQRQTNHQALPVGQSWETDVPAFLLCGR
jgi:hypothetical protein